MLPSVKRCGQYHTSHMYYFHGIVEKPPARMTPLYSVKYTIPLQMNFAFSIASNASDGQMTHFTPFSSDQFIIIWSAAIRSDDFHVS